MGDIESDANLAEFRDGPSEARAERAETSRAEGRDAVVARELLVFDYEGGLYAVPAECVDGVITWKAPTPVPGGDPRVHGVVQDRGRIVVIMSHPSGRIEAPGALPPSLSRIIVCNTPTGRIGLPASATRSVGSVSIGVEASPFSVHDTAVGLLTYLEPTRYEDR